jgi:SNF2 family DNA or RNA helicase
MVVCDVDRERLAARSAEHQEQQSIAQQLLDGRIPAPNLPLALPLRKYQLEAVALLLNAKRLLLGDEMGLGKTVTAIGMFTEPKSLPALVVTLPSVCIQWQQEIARFAPHLRTTILTKGTPYAFNRKHMKGGEAQRAMPGGLPDVIITNYHKLAGWSETLSGVVRGVVFDEAQELRIPDSAKYKAAKYISEGADYCLATTGTPVYNNGVEFHSVMDAVRPGALGTRSEFVNEWAHGTAGRERIDDPKAFGLHVRESGLMIRRTRKDVGRELPPVTRVPHHVDCDLEALNKVSNACRELALFIIGKGASPLKRDEGSKKGELMQASEELSNKLRQATGLAKSGYVAEFVRMLVEQGEKVLLMGWHRQVYAVWQERLKDIPHVMFTGTESPTQKEAAKQEFLRGHAQVMIMSLRAGAGIDGLQNVCRTICFGELDWAYGVMEQNITRLDRDGQPRQVVAYYLLSEFGIDPIMTDILNLKGAQLEGIRNPKHALVEALQGDPERIKKLAEAYLAQQGTKRAG